MPETKDKYEREEGTSEPMMEQKVYGGHTFTRKRKIVIGAVVVGVILVVVVIILLVLYLQSGQSPGQGKYTDSQTNGFRAIPGTNIVFKPEDPSSYEKYVAPLKKTLEPYHVPDGGQVIHCDENTILEENQVCNFEANWLSSCTKNDFGFSSGEPCVLLTFSNDTSFSPEVYESFADIPSDIPQGFNESMYISYKGNGDELLKLVWVHCTHAFTYLPHGGFHKQYFPNKDLDAYLPPVVGVVFVLGDEEKKNVECSLWSKTSDKMSPRPSLSFTIQKLK